MVTTEIQWFLKKLTLCSLKKNEKGCLLGQFILQEKHVGHITKNCDFNENDVQSCNPLRNVCHFLG